MGVYIHAYVEKKIGSEWQSLYVNRKGGLINHPAQIWGTQGYTLYGWLADVRNDSAIQPISDRRGLPDDVSQEVELLFNKHYERFGDSWLSLGELLDFDYDVEFLDRRNDCSSGLDDVTLPEEKGRKITYREAFPKLFFDDLDMLKAFGDPKDIRIVFCFN